MQGQPPASDSSNSLSSFTDTLAQASQNTKALPSPVAAPLQQLQLQQKAPSFQALAADVARAKAAPSSEKKPTTVVAATTRDPSQQYASLSPAIGSQFLVAASVLSYGNNGSPATAFLKTSAEPAQAQQSRPAIMAATASATVLATTTGTPAASTSSNASVSMTASGVADSTTLNAVALESPLPADSLLPRSWQASFNPSGARIDAGSGDEHRTTPAASVASNAASTSAPVPAIPATSTTLQPTTAPSPRLGTLDLSATLQSPKVSASTLIAPAAPAHTQPAGVQDARFATQPASQSASAGSNQLASPDLANSAASRLNTSIASSSDQQQQASQQVPAAAAASVSPIVAAQALPQTETAVQAVESSAGLAASAAQTAEGVAANSKAAGGESNAAPTSSQGVGRVASGKTSAPANGGPIRLQGTSTVRDQAGVVSPTTPAERVGLGPVRTVERGPAGAPSRDLHKAENDGATAPAISASASFSAASTQASSVSSAPTGASGQPDASALASVLVPANVAPQAAQPPSSNAVQSAAGDNRDADTLAAGAAGATPEAHPLPSINTAKVLQSMQGSEMRVGMHSAEFGNLSINTSVNRQSIAAQISFEHMDLGKAITAHLPSIEAKLSSDYGMHAKVEVRDQSMSSAADSGRGESRRGESSAATTATTASSALPESGDALAASSMQSGLLNESARLDIRV